MEDGGVRLYVGVDWGTAHHDVCVLDPQGEVVGTNRVDHSGEGLEALADWLRQLADGDFGSIQVAIERPHGAVVDILLERGCQVFSINPKQLDRFRDRYSPSGAKDDSRDSHVLADSLRTDLKCFHRLCKRDPILVEIREWSRVHDELNREMVALTSRFREQLLRYFPQFLQLCADLTRSWVLALWKLVPTPEKARRARPQRLVSSFKKYRVRKYSPRDALKILRQKPLTVAPGVVEAATSHIRLIVDRLELVMQQRRECQNRLTELIERIGPSNEGEADEVEQIDQRDVEILRSLPGVGILILATLVSEAPEALHGARYHTLRVLAGTAPVTKQSGKSRRVVMRRACSSRLRDASYHWARVATQRDPMWKQYYAGLRARGKRHAHALRIISDRLLHMMCAMLRHGETYDPERVRERLARAPAA